MRQTATPAVPLLVIGAVVFAAAVLAGTRQTPGPDQDLDARIARYLDTLRYTWRDMNVPASDGQLLHDLIVRHGYTRALEIGTSTGHSGIWIARGLAKTGGRLITVEIDAGRHREAVEHFKAAGVAPFIDARLADAHELVPRLEGPFDFVFIDADKDWYTNYAKAVVPKLTVGGCMTAHNVYVTVRGRGRRGPGGQGADFYEYITSLPFLETTVTPGGVSISYKREAQAGED